MRQRAGTAANLFEDHPEEKLLGDLLLVPESVASFLGGERHPWPLRKQRRLPARGFLFVVFALFFSTTNLWFFASESREPHPCEAASQPHRVRLRLS